MSIVVCCVPLIRVATYYHPISWINGLTIFARIDSIAIGCLVALNREKILSWLNAYWNIAFILSLSGLLFIPNISKAIFEHGYEICGILIGDRSTTIADLFIAVVMLYSIFGPQNWWYKLLNTALFDFIGLLSYSLYLWQQLFFDKRDHLWISQPFQNIFLLFVVALGSYYLIEKPIIKLKSKFATKSKTSRVR